MNSIDAVEFLQEILPNVPTGGFLLVGVKNPLVPVGEPGRFENHWIKWPEKKHRLERFLNLEDRDVYFQPYLYRRTVLGEENVAYGRACFADFDYGLPEDWGEWGEPTYLIQSSSGRYHGYWLVSEGTIGELEATNKAIAYSLTGSDKSGWDRVQFLRLPGTTHQASGQRVVLYNQKPGNVLSLLKSPLPKDTALSQNGANLNGESRNGFFADSEREKSYISRILGRYRIPPNLLSLWRVGVGEGDRSTALANLAFGFAEVKMIREDLTVLLLNADKRWGKFHEQKRTELLHDLIDKAYQKYPESKIAQVSDMEFLGYLDLLNSEDPPLKWIVKDTIFEECLYCLSGPPGVGKTQLALNLLARSTLGVKQSFVGFEVLGENEKLGFLSLEMHRRELKMFATNLNKAFTDEQRMILQKQWVTWAPGRSFHITDPDNYHTLRVEIESRELTGIVVDSLSSLSRTGNLSDEREAADTMDALNELRRTTGAWFLVIHHQRKDTGQGRKPKGLDDLLGHRHLSRVFDGGMLLWPKNENKTLLELSCLKARLAPEFAPFNIQKNSDLTFDKYFGIIEDEDSFEVKVKRDQKPDKFRFDL